MENSLAKRPSSAPAREIGVITQEIRQLCRQAQATAVMYVVEIGRRLVEAKGALEHGEWGRWLREEVGFSQSSAENYMKIFEEYGASQITIFGASVDSESFANLPYSKALALLSVEKEERENFAKEVDAENISVKELKAAIKERDAERARAAELEEKVSELENASRAVTESEKVVEELKNKLAAAEKSLEEEKTNTLKVKEKLEKAKKDPKLPADKLEAIKKEAAEAAKRELLEASEKELAKVKEKLATAENAKAEAERAKAAAEKSLSDAEKRLKTASPEVNRFKTLFEALQEQATKCLRQIAVIAESDKETADKLTAAFNAFVQGIVK